MGMGRSARVSVVCASASTRRVVRMELVPGGCHDALPVDAPNADGPVFIGEGALDYACASCFAVICEGIAPGDLAGIAVRCSCGTVSRIPR